MQLEAGDADIFQRGELHPRVRDQAVGLGLKLGLDLVIVNPEARSFGGRGGQSQRRNAHQKDKDAP